MIDYKKKAKEYLFLTFLLGGLFGVIEDLKFEFGTFVGGGIAILLFSVLLGSGIHYVFKAFGIIKYKSIENDEILDDSFNNAKLIAAENKIRNYMDKFKYSVWVALFFVLVALLSKLSMYLKLCSM